MEARDSRSKIRPLPIDDIDGDAPRERGNGPPRRLLPLIGIVVGAIAFGVIARGLGPTGSEVGSATTTTAVALAAEPGPTTTTEPRPPPPDPLLRLFPPASEGLHLVTFSSTGALVGTWLPSEIAPDFNVSFTQAESAAYNADGSLVAVTTRVRGGSMVIDAAEGGSPIYLQENISGGLWHPTEPALFAWTVYGDDTEVTHLRMADVSALSGDSRDVLFETTLQGRQHHLLAWGDWGFVTLDSARPFGGLVTLFDADGLDPLQLDGMFLDATPDGTLLMARALAVEHTEDAWLIPYLIQPDRVETELIGLDIGAADFRITADGDWVIAVTQQADGHTSILARTVRSRSTRLTSVDEPARIVGLTPDDRYLILQESESSDLVFKDWNTGAEFHVPIAESRAVAAVHF